MTDDLEQRLRAADPLPPDLPVETADTPSARNLMERIMDTKIETDTDPHPQPDPDDNSVWRRVAIAAVGAAAVVVIAVGAIAVISDSDDAPSITAPDPTSEVATYRLAAAGPSMGSCLALTEFVPDPSTSAFAGTVTAVDDTTATLDVTQWYTAGDATVVQLEAPPEGTVSLEGVEFVVGGNYLVSVFNDEVLVCGISGPTSPELQQLYDQWYS